MTIHLTPHMTLEFSDWRRSTMTDAVEESEEITRSTAHAAASIYISTAQGRVRAAEVLTGWTYDAANGIMYGPARAGALEAVMAAHVAASDAMADWLARIKRQD